MPLYSVTVTRTTYAEHVFEIEAKDELMAYLQALSKACDTEWNTDRAEYEVDDIELIEEEEIA
jgi:hypothetical protein